MGIGRAAPQRFPGISPRLHRAFPSSLQFLVFTGPVLLLLLQAIYEGWAISLVCLSCHDVCRLGPGFRLSRRTLRRSPYTLRRALHRAMCHARRHALRLALRHVLCYAFARASHSRICPGCILALQLVSEHSCGAHARFELTWWSARLFCAGSRALFWCGCVYVCLY